MRRKLIAVALALLLLGGVFLSVFAFEDTQDHWANAEIDRAVSLGLFRGVSETEFAPNAPMTRAMFVTVLGRMAGVDPDEWACEYLTMVYQDVDPGAYYAPYVAWAAHLGVTGGTGVGKFSPNSYVTREQMARFIANYLDATGSSLQINLPLPEHVADDAETAADAADETAALPPDGELPEPEDADASEDADDPSAAEEAAAWLERKRSENPLEGVTRSDAILARTENAAPQFSDAEQISEWARDSVVLLSSYGILRGMGDGNGGTRFSPQRNATRAECATIFCRLVDSLVPPTQEQNLPTMVVINQTNLTLEFGESSTLVATVFPVETDNDNLLWFSTEPEIATVNANGVVTGVGPGMAFIYAVSCNRHLSVCEIFVKDPPEPEPEPVDPTPPAAGLGHAGMTDHEKDMLLFGRDVDDPRTYYPPYTEDGKAAALADMVSFSIRVWDLASDGTKYTRTFWLQVHKNLAPTVQALFEELYALPEKPVIHSIGGWRWDGKCEHSCGTAIDINPMENPYVDPNGNVLVGSAFQPGVNPYSFPVGGAVDQVFAKYGFTRGIYWRSGYKDYMHYSFYGM